jgi:DNA processing protein
VSRRDDAITGKLNSFVVVVSGMARGIDAIAHQGAMTVNGRAIGVPGNMTQAVSFAPNQLIRQGAKLVTNGEDVIEDLPTPVRAALVQAEKPEAANAIYCWQPRWIPRRRYSTNC